MSPVSRLRALGWLALVAVPPVLILPDFWLLGRLTDQHVDLLPFWLPRWCFLGDTLASGHVPTWLPYQFGGVPFASDPQSGWLYAPVMLLFSVLPCHRAMGLVITLNPVLAGLGMYWFLRIEGIRPAAAAVGGLTLSLPIAGSVVALSMPFAGTLGWTAVSLAGAAGFLHSTERHRMLLWLALCGFALSQVAAAHLTNGVLIAFLVLGPYVAARSVAEVRSGAWSTRRALARAGILLAAPTLLAAAVIVPRIALLPRSTIALGYRELAELTERLTGRAAAPVLVRRGTSPWAGTALARGPGGYVGVLAVLLWPAALTARRWRWPASAFGVIAILGWLLRTDWLIGSEPIRRMALANPLGELWLRDPHRFAYLILVGVAALAGYGVEAWARGDPGRSPPGRREGRIDLRRAAAWLAAPMLVFVVAPLLAGSPVARYAPLLLAAIPATLLLVLVLRGVGGWPILLLPVLAAVELTTVGIAGRVTAGDTDSRTLQREAAGAFGVSHARLGWATIDGAAYIRPGPIGRALLERSDADMRYLAFRPDLPERQIRFGRYPGMRVVPPSYFDGRSILLHLEEIQGYSPVQLPRYWRLVRRVTGAPLFYNAATFDQMHPEVLRLFAVGSVVVPPATPPPDGAREAAREGGFVLYDLPDPAPRVTLVGSWNVVSEPEALDRTATAGSPTNAVLLEADPGFEPSPAGRQQRGSATYEQKHPALVQISVDAPEQALLLIRNPYDPNWRATIDGRPTQVLVADYVMQAVAVPAGRHRVELSYRDPAIKVGLGISTAAWLLLAVAVSGFLMPHRPRRTRRDDRAQAGDGPSLSR